MTSLSTLTHRLKDTTTAHPASRVLTQFAIVVFAVLGVGLLLGKLAVDTVISQVEHEEINDSIARTRLALSRRERRARRQVESIAENARTKELIAGHLTKARAESFALDFFESPLPLDYEFVIMLSSAGDTVFTWRLPGSVPPPQASTYQAVVPLADRLGGLGAGWMRENDLVYLLSAAAVRSGVAGDSITRGHVIVGRALTGATLDEMRRDLRLDVHLLPPNAPLPPNPQHSETIANGDSVRILIELPGIGRARAAVVEVHDTRTGLADIAQGTLAGALLLLFFGTLAVVLVWRYGRRLLLTPLHNIALEIVAMNGRGELAPIHSPPPTSEWALFVTTFNDTVRSLRDTEQRYRALFDRSVDPFFLIDAESGVVIDANPAAAAMTGVPREMLRGAPRPAAICATPSAGALRLVRPDGASQTWGVVETPVQFAGREMRLVAYRDLTDREALAQSQKMQAIGSLAGGIAHDFNNLMGSVLAGVRVARDAAPADARALSALDTIEHAGRRAAELTRQLLGLSAQESVVRIPVEVGVCIGNIVRMCESTFDPRVRFDVHVPERLGAIDGDPGQFEQALLNLCINARDAMPSGGTLRVSAREADVDATTALGLRDIQPGRYVVVSVADDGTGMSDEVKSRIFEPFFTTKGPGKGTGLGLAMVYGLLQNSGGTVTVDSAPGAGTRFDLYFPVSRNQAAPAAPAPVVTRVPAPADAVRPRVLLADDEPGLREMVRMLLESEGFDVDEAANGAEALAAIERDPSRVGVVLLDVQMPVMDGVEAFARIRALAPGVPVVLGTGYVGDHELSDIRALGADDLLTKPYDIPHLLDRLTQLAAARR
ncbi:MAG: response regulator [Gemmatimonadetes bacterium]|nr:response regulator [Gemmatimonadota bacterium]